MAYVEIDRNYQVRAAVVFPNILADSVSVTPETRLEEAVGLARAINLDVAYREIVKLREIKPSAYFSRGFVDRVKPLFETEEIELMIVDASLTPIQQRNLEKALKIKVIDRTALILEIFGERAKTKEGRLQVELAHLTYQRSRLVRSWTHLERQRGGAGFLGGPGETQIELDRRIIDDKIVRIRKELEKVKKTRELNARHANAFLIPSLLWSVIPMPASPLCSTACLPPAFLPKICCLPHSTRPCAALGCPEVAKSSCPIPSGSFPTCRTN